MCVCVCLVVGKLERNSFIRKQQLQTFSRDSTLSLSRSFTLFEVLCCRLLQDRGQNLILVILTYPIG